MIQSLDERGFIDLRMAKCRSVVGVKEMGTAAMAAVARRLLSELSSSQSIVLLSLVHLTVGSGRVARMMSTKELESGFDGDQRSEFAGTNLSRNTLRVALDGLAERDFIHVYREERRYGYEGSARIFEINFTKFDLDFGEKLQETLVRGGQNLTPSSYISISDFVTHEKGTQVASYLSPAGLGGASVENVDMAYVGKKEKVETGFASRPAPTAVAKVQSVLDASRTKTATRAATAAKALPGGIDRAGLQALFDSIREECGVPYRLVVTVKEFGVLRKRLVAAAPDDLKAMLKFSLTYWPTLAQQNSRAVSKDGDKLVKAKSLPPAQHFSTFAYWYPYFLKAYQNHLAGRNSQTMQNSDDRRIAQLQAELERTRGQVTMLRRQRTVTVTPTPAVKPPVVPRRRVAVDDCDLPVWK